MGTDHDWIAIRAIVEAGLRDAWALEDFDSASEQELQDAADTVTDHLATALTSGVLVRRPRWWSKVVNPRSPASQPAN